MAIKTINKLKEQNEMYELALKVCKEAIQKNLAYAMYKDEEVLYGAFKIIEKSLSNS